MSYDRNHIRYLDSSRFKSFFVMLCCPNCKTLKSIFSQIEMEEIDEDGREQIICKVCNHSWKRFPYGGGFGGGG